MILYLSVLVKYLGVRFKTSERVGTVFSQILLLLKILLTLPNFTAYGCHSLIQIFYFPAKYSVLYFERTFKVGYFAFLVFTDVFCLP